MSSLFLKNKIAFFSLIFITLIKTSFALPQDPIIEFGEANFDTSFLKELNITTSDKAIINWEGFSIDIDEIARFIQPDKNSIVLNRVRGETRSEISGNLLSNGNVFLINKNGLFFSKEAIIDTNSFTASTLDVLNQTFLENKEINFKGDSKEAIINLGTIKAKDGDVTLLGFMVSNKGILKAPNGEVILTCGNEILLCPNSDQKVFIKPQIRDEESTKEIGINNSGTIEAIQTKMIAEGKPYQYAIKHTGEIDAFGISTKDGKVYLIAEGGANLIDGKITCKNEDETGGEVRLLGECVQLLDNANIDVSANFDGGSVLIGGDYQGANPDIINAKAVYVAENAHINASSLLDGNGGKVILWSDELTQFYGNILAQGGKTKGDGGFVEISSLGLLDPSGLVSTKAYFGENGTLLLDPPDVTVSTAATSPAGAVLPAAPPPPPPPGGPYDYSFNAPGPPFNINNGNLATFLNDNNVTINTAIGTGGGPTGTITVNDIISWSAPNSLTMIAGTSITLNDEIRNTDQTIPGTTIGISLQAPTITLGSLINNGPVTVSSFSGKIELQAPTMLELYGGGGPGASSTIIQASSAGPGVVGSIDITAGDILLLGGSSIGGADIGLLMAGIGGITINATGDFTCQGGTDLTLAPLTTRVVTARSSTGDININMSGDNTTLSFLGGIGVSGAGLVTLINGDVNINMTGANSDLIIRAGTTALAGGGCQCNWS